MNPETQMALNLLLHESTVEGIEVDTDALHAVCTLDLTAEPTFGVAPANPCILLLRGVTRVRVALINPDGTAPPKGMNPIPIGSLNSLIRQFKHPQQGLDFVDSTRDDILWGLPVVDWVGNETAARHTVTFFYGVRSQEGRDAILLVRLWFDQVDLRDADGSTVDLRAFANADAFAKAGMPIIKVAGTTEGIRAMPDPTPAQMADGSLIALVFVDSQTKWARCRAVGKGVWNGKELKWFSPGGKLYDLPAGKQLDIRPTLADWSQPGDPMSGVKFWTAIEISQDDPINQRDLVEKYLRSSSATPRLDS
jgi:hypothetical protein